MHITIKGRHGSIADMEWQDVPPFAVITGVNGAGKTQLLEIIAHSYGALRAARPEPPIDARATISGSMFSRGEVFHSYGDWPVLAARGASEEGIKEYVGDLKGEQSGDELRIEELSNHIGISPDEVRKKTALELYELVTPQFLWGRRLIRTPASLPELFLGYNLYERDLLANGLSHDEIRLRIGEPPWELLNEILGVSGLPFSVEPPPPLRPTSLLRANTYNLQLTDLVRGGCVPLSAISSGEKVIMSTALWRYSAVYGGGTYKLLLLDEPDAHLHPSLTRRFLDVLQSTFVAERGVRVIMTTHSPTTVAMTPSECLFEMHREEPRVRPARRKAAVVAWLTDGFVAVQESSQTILVEGPDDPRFYQMVWDLLTERTEVSSPPYLDVVPGLIFVHGQGRNTVEAIVPQMKNRGLETFHGLVDRDLNPSTPDGVVALGRNGVENYLFDPLVVWLTLHLEGKAPHIDRLALPAGRSGSLRTLPATSLQSIVDAITSRIERARPHLTTAIRVCSMSSSSTVVFFAIHNGSKTKTIRR